MSGNINKIQTIKRMAVFHDFKWDSSIRDSDNNIADFKKLIQRSILLTSGCSIIGTLGASGF